MFGRLARYRNDSWSDLDARKRRGFRPKLDAKAIQWIYKTLTDKNPLQLMFTFGFLTAKMIGQVIYKQFGARLSKYSVCRLLAQLGLTPLRPIWRDYQQRYEEVQKWLQEEYPCTRQLAKKRRL
jgi:transposase